LSQKCDKILGLLTTTKQGSHNVVRVFTLKTAKDDQRRLKMTTKDG